MILAAGLSLVGCNESLGTGAPEKSEKVGNTESGPLSMTAMAAEATGFTVGSKVNARTMYVFFDAQCPHCGALWKAAKPLTSQAKFVWIPVSIINPSSTAQCATLLAATDWVAAMDEHETSLLAKQGGIGAAGNLDAQKASVAKNTELMSSFGFVFVPTIVGTNAQTGALVRQDGSLSTAELAKLLGPQVPASQPASLSN